MRSREWPEETLEIKEQTCIVCGRVGVQLAHVTGRIFDRPRTPGSNTVYVEPESIVPLCPDDHRDYDAHSLDILSYLNTPEQVRAVEDYGSIDSALHRLAPVATREAEQAKARIIELEAHVHA